MPSNINYCYKIKENIPTQYADVSLIHAHNLLFTNALKDDNIRFKFEYVTNGSSNNFYIDNILIGEETSLIQTLDHSAKLSIYPNPTNGAANIIVDNMEDKYIQLKLTNILIIICSFLAAFNLFNLLLFLLSFIYLFI